MNEEVRKRPIYQVDEHYTEVSGGETIHRFLFDRHAMEIIAYEHYTDGSTATAILRRISDRKLFRYWVQSNTAPAIEVGEVKAPKGVLPKKPSGAQRKKDTRKRVLRGGIWRLDIWQPHARVLRGKVRDGQ